MKKIVFILSVMLIVSTAWSAERACLQMLTPFVCKDGKNVVVENRCAASKTPYQIEKDGLTLNCTPVQKSTEDARTEFLNLVKTPSSDQLKKFKSVCNYASPINFLNDADVSQGVKKLVHTGEVFGIRALLFAESNCANETSHEIVLGWLGNEMLIHQASGVIQAFYDENKAEHLNEIAKRENNEWRNLECKTNTCRLQRNTYFEGKLNAVKKAKISKSMEPVRQKLLGSLKMVSDASKFSFLELMKNPSTDNLADFKKKCSIASPVDFVGDTDLYTAIQNLFQHGNVFGIRALIHADAYCADIINRKNILSWLGNELLIKHPASLIDAMSYEDQKHELYDIAELENKEWRETQCMGDPCETNRKEYFASKRKALESATIPKKHEPYRRQLLKYLTSDQ